ncbi:hypothetical protein [Lacrimispora xylanisolvens]|uniref:hypothetical protein n=1 Tax=Lacrimispora xylanisolvens TaxID=384636 RepID=UPI002402A576
MEEVQDDDIDKVFLQIQKELRKIEPDTNKRRGEPSGWSEFHGPGFTMMIPGGFEEVGRGKSSVGFLLQEPSGIDFCQST